jgi:hypothetical protein
MCLLSGIGLLGQSFHEILCLMSPDSQELHHNAELCFSDNFQELALAFYLINGSGRAH